MKRDPRLHGLSSDHHHALVLVWRIRHQMRTPVETAGMLARARDAFTLDLQRHFEIEESVLLPALDAVEGGPALVRRTLDEHAKIRASVSGIDERTPGPGLLEFASLLHAHVRFEENELFPACERLLPPEVLDRVAALAPKPATAPPRS